MRCENDYSKIFKDPRVLSFGIVHLIAYIVCTAVVVRRIRRQRQRRYPFLEDPMDPPSGKRGGEGKSTAASERVAFPRQSPGDPPFPSACDILQPLSHLSALPSSGYLAAVLSRERSVVTGQLHQQGDNSHAGSAGTVLPGSVANDSQVTTARTNRNRRSPSSGSENPLLEATSPLQAATPPNRRSAASHDQGLDSWPNSLDSSEVQSVQKRDSAVHFLHDVDEDGPRSWRRLVVEYS